MWTLAQTIGQLTSRLPPAIASGDGMARLDAAARQLPAALTHCIFLECWLPEAVSRVDLILRLRRHGRALLADPALAAFAPRLRAQTSWQRIAAFARAWDVADGPLARGLEGAWIEFDLAPATAGDPVDVPRVFVDFTPALQRDPSCEARLELAHEALRLLLGAPLAPAAAASLRACFAALPPGARVPYLGLTASDAAAGVRVCVTGLGARLPDYLAALRWPGNAAALSADVLEPTTRVMGDARGRPAILHLDLRPELASRIALEFAFARRVQRQGRLHEEGSVERIVAQGWGEPVVAELLRDWPGRATELLPHEIWQSLVDWRVSHLKVSYAPGVPVVRKLYLCVFHELLRGGALLAPSAAYPAPRFVNAPAQAAWVRADAAAAAEPGLAVRSEVAADGRPLLSNSAGAPSAAARAAGPRADTERLRGVGLAQLARVPPVWLGTGGFAMELLPKQQRALEEVLRRASVDADFRKQLLISPRHAIEDAYEVSIPPTFKIKFIERDPDVDALIVLPDLHRSSGVLSDDCLEDVAGGGGGGEGDPEWGDDIP